MTKDYSDDQRPSPTDEVREYDVPAKRTFVLTITTDYPDGEQAARDAAHKVVEQIGWGDDNTSSFELVEIHGDGTASNLAGWEFEPGEQSDEPNVPDYIWPDPSGTGWIDAWNGWYDTLERALEEAAGGGSRPWILNKGEGLIDEDERERRDALRKLLADWFEAELFRISERGHSSEWPALIDDAKARHATFGLPWTNEFVPAYVREILALGDDD